MEDPFNLASPAIENLEGRTSASNAVREEKEKERALKRMRRENRNRETEKRKRSEHTSGNGSVESVQPIPANTSLTDEGLIPFDSLQPEEPQSDRTDSDTQRDSVPRSPSKASSDNPKRPRRSNKAPETPASKTVRGTGALFEGDLDVRELEKQSGDSAAHPIHATEQPKAHPIPLSDALDDLDDLAPDIGISPKELNLPPLADDSLEDSEYRIVCATCGTAQYVSPSAKGMKIKCPDCYADFKVPPPPTGWKPKKKKRLAKSASIGDAIDDELGLAEAPTSSDSADLQKRERTELLLEKAQGEISEEHEDSLYQSDFDHATFVQNTFGFLRDPLVLVQLAGYGFVFFILFWLLQFGFNDTNSQFGRGVLLLTVVFVPVVGILFALPMLSGGLALIESVANKQKFVREIPAFNIFDNVADLLVIAAAFFAAIIPGFMLGVVISGEDSGFMFQVCGMVVSGFFLFPVLLLSMLDNGSVFAPVSNSVIRSFLDATEAWGGYYLKTFVVSSVVVIAWLVLLGRAPILAGIAGILLPLLIFFTCQQIGALADKIGDHLSFDFSMPSDEDDEGRHGEGDKKEILDLEDDVT